jgi:hypothetical protein
MRTLKHTLVGLVAAAGATLATAVPAHAGLLVSSAKDCDSPPSARVFLPWLDLARYVAAPGGQAESARGWELEGGARIVGGNEPWKVGARGDAASLFLPAGSRATTAPMCVGLGHPTMRFFARRSGGSLLSPMAVEVLFNGLGGALRSLPIGVVLNGGQWQPTLPYPVLANLLPLLPGEQTPVAFRFTPIGGASWQVDDVYVDPWRAK